jgi:sugar-specific transcriptional regulator TrmB
VENTGEYLSTLTDLGLSTTQAKVYLTLMKLQAQTAQEISKASGVARSDIYRVLNELEKAGHVERIITKPERFQPTPIDSFVSSLMQERIRKTAELQKKSFILVKNFRQRTVQKKTEESFQFVLIPARAAVYAKAEKMLKNAQKCICFLGLRKRMAAWLSNYYPLFEEALSRRVDCRIIVPQVEKEQIDGSLKDLSKYSNLTLRTIQQEPKAGFSVWDRKEILISTSTIDTPYPYPTLWSNNKAIVDLSQDYFEFLWEKAKKDIA